MPVVTIEIDGQHNESLSFRPLQRSIRGRFDLNRDSEPQSKLAASEQPGPVPGQRLGFDSDKSVGFLEESLHDDENEVLREQLANRGFRFASKREEFENVDADSFCYWLKRAVESGVAKVVSGKFPKIDESKVQKNFITKELPSSTDRLTIALENQNRLFEALLSKLST